MRDELQPRSCGQFEPSEQFGWCPDCGRQDGYLNIGRMHWFICNAHRTRWTVAENLFSSWRDETEADWRENAAHIERYREVDGYDVSLALLRRMRAMREMDEGDCDH